MTFESEQHLKSEAEKGRIVGPVGDYRPNVSAIRDRIVEFRRVKASELLPNAKNPRTHPERQQAALRGVLEEVGYVDALLAYEEEGGSLRLIDGHLRAETTPDMEVPVLILDVDEAEADKILATFDPLSAMAEFDATKLDELLRDVETGSEALAEMLTDLADDNGLYQDEEVVEDEVPEVPEDPITQPGDLWLLGEHRVLCGDSTNEQDVARLMDGEKADMVIADPPYGMDLDPRYDAMHSSPSHRKTGDRFAPIIGDQMDFNPTVIFELLPATEHFWWGADYYRSHLPGGGSWLVWDKRDNDVEMDLDEVIGSSFELCWSKRKHARRIIRALWSGHHGMQCEDTRLRVHPTQKPIKAISWIMRRFSEKHQLIADPFLGSGTTLIAAEQLGRRCYGMEISPQYVDVIVKRWENLTGGKAVLCEAENQSLQKSKS